MNLIIAAVLVLPALPFTPVEYDPPPPPAVELCETLPHRKLLGHTVWSEEELLALPEDQIDLARGLLISQLAERDKIEAYEAQLDMMALQVLAKLPANASDAAKVAELNRFIFFERHFRFPPMASYQEAIDQYTFLPAVVDARRGVCLGVSTLYLSLAQRLDLKMEAITPPGHIYVQTLGPNPIRVETTARGIHLEEEDYLSIETTELQHRTLREVIGMTFFNQAGLFIRQAKYAEAADAYRKTLKYTPGDPLVLELLAYQLIMLGQDAEARALLTSFKSEETTPADYLAGAVGSQGIAALFLPVDGTRASTMAKRDVIAKVMETYPRFRAGWMQLAMCWAELGRTREAVEALDRFHELDPTDRMVEQALAVLSYQRQDMPKAWKHLTLLEGLCVVDGELPRSVKEMRLEFTRRSR